MRPNRYRSERSDRAEDSRLTMYKKVLMGIGTTVDGPAILGKPPRGHQDGDFETELGENCTIRPFTTIYAGSVVGSRVETGQSVTIREDNVIGDDVSIGTNSTLEFGNKIGDRVRIHSGCFLESAVVGNDVFIGPNVVFCDDPHPMGCPRYQDCRAGPKIEDFARIGANSTILPGVVIGRNALVGAGSVVVKDVPANTVVAGNPAVVIKTIDDLVCHAGFFSKPYEWLEINEI